MGLTKRMTALLLTLAVLLSSCSWSASRREAEGPCTVRGLARAPVPALTPLPAWPFPAPETREKSISNAWFATLYEGTQARVIMDGKRWALLDAIEPLLAEQPVQVVRQGAWRAVWPQMALCLEGRPVIRLGYSSANKLELPDVALLPFRQREGELRVATSALWIAPSRSKGEVTWLIATAMGPMDQRSLIYRQPNAGYTLDGPVTVMALPFTEGAGALAADLARTLAEHRPTEAQAGALAQAEAAAAAGDWPAAATAYERLLVLTEREAREPGPYGADRPFFSKEYHVVEISPPEMLLQMARAAMAAGQTVYGAREALLHASYLAEEQGKQELLAEIRAAFKEFMAIDSFWAEVLHRLAELEPGEPEHWWRLVERRWIIAPGFEPEPAVAVAEAVGGADPQRAASLYLRQAGDAVLVTSLDHRTQDEQERTERAVRLLEEALRRQPDHPYGLFLKGVRESRLGNAAAALQILAQVAPNPAVRHEQAIARGAAAQPVLAVDLYTAPETMTELALKEAYSVMGYWNYSYKMPSPPAQEAVWAPSGEWLATTCTRFTGQGFGYETDLCLVKLPAGAVHRVAASPYRMAWAMDGLLYSLREGGLWLAAPGGQPQKLAPAAYEIAVGPDGYQVAFTTDAGLWALDLRGRGAPRMIAAGKAISSPLWSPDGKELFFARELEAPEPWLTQQIVYRVAADRPAAPAEVGRQSAVSLIWFNITALRWWEPGETLLVRHGLYGGWEHGSQVTLLPLDGAPVTVKERLPAAMQERAETALQYPDRQRELIWVQDGPGLIPVPMGEGEAPRSFSLSAWPGYTEPQLGSVHLAPGRDALAYTYSFGEGAHLFVAGHLGQGAPTYLRPASETPMGYAFRQPHEAPLDWFRQRALPGQPVSWSPDGRYLAWLKGDRLELFDMGQPDS